jgi:sigma-E factor negative regulatory protein RseA
MASEKVTRQDISALADGELDAGQARKIIIALRDSEQRNTWSVYHQIGDSLREQQMVAPVSAQFSARMAARLEAEPTILAPVGLFKRVQTWPAALAAIAAAVMAFVLAPQLSSFWSPATQHELVNASSHPALANISQADAKLAANTAQSREQASQRRAAEVDDYIFAHQSAYPSLYGTAQLARPASHSESEK